MSHLNTVNRKLKKLLSFCNISRHPCDDATAPQGAAAHVLGTTAIDSALKGEKLKKHFIL